MANSFDFGGWATRNDLECADGRTIRKDAFIEQDGKTVPLVWNHQHESVHRVLGHALLENRDEGVYAYCSFNDTEAGQDAKLLVQHGDVTALSIYANKLKQNGGNVLHGAIREVSLVLAGANKGAYIDNVMFHGDVDNAEGAIFHDAEGLTLYHGEEPVKKEKSEESEKEEKDEDPKESEKEEEESKEPEKEEKDEKSEGKEEEDSEEIKHAEGEEKMAEDNRTVKDVFDGFSEEQKNVVYFMIGKALEDAGVSEEGEDEKMKHNVFDNDRQEGTFLSHADMETIFESARRHGSLKEAVDEFIGDAQLIHAEDAAGNEIDYGIANMDYLFPEAKNLNNPPEFIKRDVSWVSKVMGGTKHVPFSRIKSTFANITEDEARAKGYIKGNLKKEEVFPLLKRSTTPTTIYKKQKLDRDDIIDITDFDVVAWLKGEMRGMLDEEIARAILIGDGRNAVSEDKIDESHIRPVWTDADLFTVKKVAEVASSATDNEKAVAFIKRVVKARKDYKGSGNPTLFTTEDLLTDMLLITDSTGRDIYDSVEKLKTKLRVSDIVTVPVMENLTRTVSGATHTLQAILVNLSDYTVGADKGGGINMFDDFDIDYNQEKYLIETRCSGALTKPYSAIVFETKPQAQG